MLYKIFCPSLELVSFGVGIVSWLKGCVFIVLAVFAPSVSPNQLLAEAQWEKSLSH